jgi:guanylate kinase
LLKDYPDLEESVSATTRKIRPGEIEGKDYYFLSEDEFKRNLLEGNFFEHERVHGNYYGTLKSEVEKKLAKNNVILELDIKGAFTIKKSFGDNSVLIFILTQNVDELRRRLINRKTDSMEVIEKRVKESENEISKADRFDYRILNDKIEKAYKELVTIYKKERS